MVGDNNIIGAGSLRFFITQFPGQARQHRQRCPFVIETDVSISVCHSTGPMPGNAPCYASRCMEPVQGKLRLVACQTLPTVEQLQKAAKEEVPSRGHPKKVSDDCTDRKPTHKRKLVFPRSDDGCIMASWSTQGR